MNRIDILEKLISDGYTQIRCLHDRVWVSKPDAPIVADADGVALTLDFEQSYRRLQALFRTQETFSLRQMALAAGIAYSRLETWERHSVFNAGARRGRGKRKCYSFADLFVAGVLGSLRRHGASVPAICKAGRLVRDRYDLSPLNEIVSPYAEQQAAEILGAQESVS